MNIEIVAHRETHYSHEVACLHGVWIVVERARYNVRCDSARAAHFGGRSLPRDDGGFMLELSFWCGKAKLDVVLDDGEQRTVELEVLADPNKLSGFAWERMLDDIDARWPGRTVGVEGGLHGSTTDDGTPSLLALLPLVDTLPKLVAQLRELIEHLRTRDVLRHEAVPLRSLRRLDASTARWIAQHPHAASALFDQRRDEDRLQRTLVEQRLRTASFDHPANRALRWLVDRVRAKLHELAAFFESKARELERNSLTDAEEWCSKRREQVQHASNLLRATVDASVLAQLRAEPPDTAALLTITNDALYERVFRRCRRWIAPRFEREGDGTGGVSIATSFDLYERWCLLHIERSLAAAFPALEWRDERVSEGTARVGRADGTRVALYDNLSFKHWREGAERYAIISERVPDFVITVERGHERKWILLDAKYRCHALSVRDALDEIGLYRASLRWERFGGECAAAAILVPSVGAGAERWAHEAFVGRFAFGAIEARPEHAGTLARWLREWLGASGMVELAVSAAVGDARERS